ncbi:MAG: MarR family winged helix-turn-helix transcriptional regulator [Pseudomonadota bacterium]|nr:MarR family winged helix-turn-helix transcriptional regulator [Pseudomonadota bacterium]
MVKSGNKAKRGGLAASPSHLMHRALQLALDIYADEAGPDGLTQRQFAVLEAVSHKSGLTQTDLVRATGIDRSTLADLVSRMTTKGLLDRERSTIDARAKAVRLSETGQAALDAARPRVEAADKRILALLPKARRDSFLIMLAELAGEADAAPVKAKADLKAAKKAARDAKKAEKLAKKSAKAEKPPKAKLKLVEPA